MNVWKEPVAVLYSMAFFLELLYNYLNFHVNNKVQHYECFPEEIVWRWYPQIETIRYLCLCIKAGISLWFQVCLFQNNYNMTIGLMK